MTPPDEQKSVGGGVRRLRRALPKIEAALSQEPTRVFTSLEVRTFLTTRREEWGLATIGSQRLVNFLTEESHLQPITLESQDYPSVKRFIWKKASPFEIGLAIRRGS